MEKVRSRGKTGGRIQKTARLGLKGNDNGVSVTSCTFTVATGIGSPPFTSFLAW